jgi:hypothetical protein
MAVYIAASVEGLSRINLEQDGWKSWERTRLGKNVNKNVNKGKRGICGGSLTSASSDPAYVIHPGPPTESGQTQFGSGEKRGGTF